MDKSNFIVALATTERERVDKLKVKLMSAGDFTTVRHKQLSVEIKDNVDLVVVDVTKVDKRLMDFLDSVFSIKEADDTLGTTEFDVEVCFLDTKGLLREEVARSPYYYLYRTPVFNSADDIIEIIRRKFVEGLF